MRAIHTFALVFWIFLASLSIDCHCSALDAEDGDGESNEGQLLSEELRDKLSTKLNEIIDIPILGENQEQVLAEKVVDMCLDAFAESKVYDEIEEMKKDIRGKLVSKLNQKVNIPFANEELEGRVLSKIVDFILKDRFSADADEDDLKKDNYVVPRMSRRAHTRSARLATLRGVYYYYVNK